MLKQRKSRRSPKPGDYDYAERLLESHCRYLNALRMCQKRRKPLGHIRLLNVTYVGYVCDGQVWMFSRGVTLGPASYNGHREWMKSSGAMYVD